MKSCLRILAAASLIFSLTACSASASAASSASSGMDEATALSAYQTASAEMEKFYLMQYRTDAQDTFKGSNGGIYYRVLDYDSLDDLKNHLTTMVSEDYITDILEQWANVYQEENGRLYMLGADTPVDQTKGKESDAAAKVSDTEYLITATVETLDPKQDGKVTGSQKVEFHYVNQKGAWRFQEFPKIK